MNKAIKELRERHQVWEPRKGNIRKGLGLLLGYLCGIVGLPTLFVSLPNLWLPGIIVGGVLVLFFIRRARKFASGAIIYPEAIEASKDEDYLDPNYKFGEREQEAAQDALTRITLLKLLLMGNGVVFAGLMTFITIGTFNTLWFHPHSPLLQHSDEITSVAYFLGTWVVLGLLGYWIKRAKSDLMFVFHFDERLKRDDGPGGTSGMSNQQRMRGVMKNIKFFSENQQKRRG